MRISCAMMSSRVTPPEEEKGVDVDEVEEVGEAVVPDRLERSCASLRLTIAASMSHMTWKW